MVEIQTTLNGKGITNELFIDFQPDPTDENVLSGADRFSKMRADSILAIGGGSSLDVAKMILDRLGKPHSLMQHVGDRPGHDRRYALDTSKAEALVWDPRHDFSIMLAETVDWYAANEPWWRAIKSGEFAEWYTRNYAARGVHVG